MLEVSRFEHREFEVTQGLILEGASGEPGRDEPEMENSSWVSPNDAAGRRDNDEDEDPME